MFRPTCLVLVATALVAASCRSGPSDERLAEWGKGGGIRQDLRDYRVIVSAHKGKVGYLKTYDVHNFGEPPYPWDYVYDLNWKELGFITNLGSAVRYHYYSPAEQAAENVGPRGDWLPSDSIQHNVMRMLDLDLAADDVTFPHASHADIGGDPNAPHKAGPGVTPTPAVSAEKPAK